MAFIRTVAPEQAEGAAGEMYRQIQHSLGNIPNWAYAFGLRPEVRDAWAELLQSVRRNLDLRTYELATLAASRALRSSYCALVHGKILADKVFGATGLEAILNGSTDGPLEPREVAVMEFAEKVALAADRITAGDVERLRAHGYRDEQIFDIAATAAARCFFSKLLDALGIQADASFGELDPGLRSALTVGRPVAEPGSPPGP